GLCRARNPSRDRVFVRGKEVGRDEKADRCRCRARRHGARGPRARRRPRVDRHRAPGLRRGGHGSRSAARLLSPDLLLPGLLRAGTRRLRTAAPRLVPRAAPRLEARPRLRLTDSGDAAGAPSPRRRPELAREQPEHDLVHPASLDEHLLAASALHLKADARIHSEPSLIDRVAGEADLVEVERLEGVTAEQAERLGAEAASPAFLAADY